MVEVQRYAMVVNCDDEQAEPREFEHGAWVRYDDYAALRVERDRLREALANLPSLYVHPDGKALSVNIFGERGDSILRMPPLPEGRGDHAQVVTAVERVRAARAALGEGEDGA